MAVVSPEIGREFCLKYDQELADAFDGIAIHSCGTWQHLMPDVAKMQNVVQVDCAIHIDSDPCPNDPEAVRDAFVGSGIPVKVRGPHSIDAWKELLPRLVHKDLRLIIQLEYVPDPVQSTKNYDAIDRLVAEIYNAS